MNGIDTELPNGLDETVGQVCSPLYTQTFEKIAKEQPFMFPIEEQRMLLEYPNVIILYKGDRRHEIIERIRRTHLKWFNNWLSEQIIGQPPYVEWLSPMKYSILQLTNLLFRLDFGDIITSEETRNDFIHIADTSKRILLSISQSNPVTIDQAVIPFVRILLQILFYYTLDTDLVIYLKNLQLVDLMTVLLRTSNDDDEIHLHSYRILAVILAEADIKKLQNSNRVAAVFITFINDVIDEGTRSEARLYNTLRSLKVLTQHDEIREELIKQNGHSLFLRCALEDKFDPLKAKLPALEILLALSFNKDFAATLKNNVDFMNHIRTLTSSPHEDLQRVATAFIWKLEKEKDHKSSPTSVPKVAKKQYDIMISYSHSDKELSHRILNVLEKDQLRVWIDSQLMHGATFDAMAEAIENSEFVLMCMSDAYKQSPFCKMEASYAIKRQCHIIPLTMTPNYKADGWLGVLTSALIYVDFPKLGFDKAYRELKKQMGLYQMNDSYGTAVKKDEIHHNPITFDDVKPIKKKEPRPAVVEYPHCINAWTEEHVKSFLLDKELDVLLPLLEGMNGQLLHQVYCMCQGNQQGMYLSMKDDLARSQHEVLSLKDYVILLRELKVYVPYVVGNQLNPTSAVCNLM